MIKALLIDADGIVIRREAFFSQRYAQRIGVTWETMMPFFRNEYRDCQRGRRDLKIELAKRLEEWQWNGSVDELLEWWFSAERIVNKEIMAIIKNLRAHGIRCYLVTDNERYRTIDIWEGMKLKDHFDGIFCSAFIGHTKSEGAFYQNVLRTLSPIKPDEILFLDDDQANIDVALQNDMQAHLYSSTDQLSSLL